jgi:hypothetical protein
MPARCLVEEVPRGGRKAVDELRISVGPATVDRLIFNACRVVDPRAQKFL